MFFFDACALRLRLLVHAVAFPIRCHAGTFQAFNPSKVLHVAAGCGNVDLLRQLLDMKADISATCDDDVSLTHHPCLSEVLRLKFVPFATCSEI